MCSLGTRARLGAIRVGRVRMLRAVKGSLGHSPKETYRELKELSSTLAVETRPAASLIAGALKS